MHGVRENTLSKKLLMKIVKRIENSSINW